MDSPTHIQRRRALTSKRYEVLLAIHELTKKHRMPPSLNEVVVHTGIPRTTVWRLVSEMSGDWLQPRLRSGFRQLKLRRRLPVLKSA